MFYGIFDLVNFTSVKTFLDICKKLFVVDVCSLTSCVEWLICYNTVVYVTRCCCCAVRAALRTTPRDSTGIPHILEHLSLCGSTKYPVRDPFFKMLTRSLSTFMNAFTGELLLFPYSDTRLVPVCKIVVDFLCILLCHLTEKWTLWLKKCTILFGNNFVKPSSILIIFGTRVLQ